MSHLRASYRRLVGDGGGGEDEGVSLLFSIRIPFLDDSKQRPQMKAI